MDVDSPCSGECDRATVLSKKIRSLNKKLRQIKRIGTTPSNMDQAEKLRRRPQYESELEDLQDEFDQISPDAKAAASAAAEAAAVSAATEKKAPKVERSVAEELMHVEEQIEADEEEEEERVPNIAEEEPTTPEEAGDTGATPVPSQASPAQAKATKAAAATEGAAEPAVSKKKAKKAAKEAAAVPTRQPLAHEWEKGACRVQHLEGHNDIVTCVQLCSEVVVSGSYDTTIKLWDRASGKELRNFGGHTNAVTSVHYDESANTVYSGSSDGWVKVWNGETGKPNGKMSVLSPINSLSFDGGSCRIATGSNDGHVRLFDPVKERMVLQLKGHSDEVRCVQLDGDMVYSGAADGSVRVWDSRLSRGSQEVRALTGHTMCVYCLQVRGNTLMCGDGGRNVKMWDLRHTSHSVKLPNQRRAGPTSALHFDGEKLITTSRQENGACLRVRALTDKYQHLYSLSESVEDVDFTCLQFEDNCMVTGSYDSVVRLWTTGASAKSQHVDARRHEVFDTVADTDSDSDSDDDSDDGESHSRPRRASSASAAADASAAGWMDSFYERCSII